jgi:radical SAM protein with 4Fe4S-binding SPASM domain
MRIACNLPTHGVFIGENGNVTPCCGVTYAFGNLKDLSLNQAFHTKKAKQFRKNFKRGIYEQDCINCYKSKSAHRTFWGLKKTKIKDLSNQFIAHAEVTFSNICNLTCTMCSPRFSHKWAKLLGQEDKIFSLTEEQVVEMAYACKDVGNIQFKGGEPFFQPHINLFLSELYKHNPSAELVILTNGTIINDSTIEIFSKFKNTTVAVSAEASGKLYQYIRGGAYTFEKDVVNNLKKLKQEKGFKRLIVPIASCIGLYNFDKWIEHHQNITDCLNDNGMDTTINIQGVSDPVNQSLYLKSKKTRNEFKNNLYKSKLNFNHANTGFINLDYIENRTTKDKILNGIEFHNKIKKLNLFEINPKVLDNIDESVL